MNSGHAGIREIWGKLFEKSEWIRLRIGKRVVKGPYVFDVECGFAKTKGADGVIKSVKGAALYKVENGLIQEMLFMPAGDDVAYPKEIGEAGTYNLAELCAKS